MSESVPIEGSFDDLPVDEPWPGVRRRTFNSDKATVTSYDFEPGARFPLHSHPEEQITLVNEGDIELTVAGEVKRLAPGDWSVVPPEIEHGVRGGASGAKFVAIVMPRRDSPNAYTVSGEEPR